MTDREKQLEDELMKLKGVIDALMGDYNTLCEIDLESGDEFLSYFRTYRNNN